MRVVLTKEAISDLFEIGEYIRSDNPERAFSFTNELLKQCHSLQKLPLAFPLVYRYANLNIRKKPYKNYLIFYRVQESDIEIIHIIHGARDYDDLLT